MNRFVIKFKNESTLIELNKLGEITYQDSIVNVVFLSTKQAEAALLKVDGVISIKRERSGKLCI